MLRPSPLRRRSPLRARTPMGRKPSPQGDAPEYRARVRTLPCVGLAHIPGHVCAGRLDPHHAGKRPGVAMKASDLTCIPACRLLHEQIETLTGPFRGFAKERMRAWEDAMIALTLNALGAA